MENPVQSPLYNLRWGDYLPNMLNVFEQLFRKEEYTDVTLWLDAGNVFIKCHKIILAACSTFFEDIFSTTKSKGHANVVLTDMKYSEIKPILEFIYKGEVNITQDDLEGILKTANLLRIKGLIPEYNEKYDAKFEPDIDIVSNDTSEKIKSSDAKPAKGSSNDEEKKPTAEELETLTESVPPHHLDPEQVQYDSSDNGYEKQAKKIIKDEPHFNEPFHSNNNETFARQSHYDFPRTPKGSFGNKRRRDSVESFKTEFTLQDYQNDMQLGGVKAIKKQPRQDGICNTSTSKEWRKYKKYSPEELEAALQAMRKGLSPIAASKEFNIPSRTLYDKAKKLGIDTKDIRRNYNKSAAFPIGIGQNIDNRIYKSFQETDFDRPTITPNNSFLYEAFTRSNILPETPTLEMMSKLRAEVQPQPSTSNVDFENTAQDLSINKKQDESVEKPNSMT